MQSRSRAKALSWLTTMALLAAAGCGSVADDRVTARNQATKATCDQYQFCGDIGAGKTYATYDACTVQWQANWDSYWPANLCQGKIDQAALHVCLSAIGGTSCTNILDFFSTLGKCSKENICIGAADAAVD